MKKWLLDWSGRERHCCRSFPSEPDVKVSPHPAQAVAKPHASRAGRRGNFPCDLDGIHLQPADRTHILEPVRLVRLCRFAGGCRPGLRHVHLRFPPAQVLPVFSSRTTHWKSRRLHGGVMLQLLSFPLQNGIGSFQHPLPAISTAHLAVTPASLRSEMPGLSCPTQMDMNHLVPVS